MKITKLKWKTLLKGEKLLCVQLVIVFVREHECKRLVKQLKRQLLEVKKEREEKVTVSQL